MTLKALLRELNKLIESNPDSLDMEVVAMVAIPKNADKPATVHFVRLEELHRHKVMRDMFIDKPELHKNKSYFEDKKETVVYLS